MRSFLRQPRLSDAVEHGRKIRRMFDHPGRRGPGRRHRTLSSGGAGHGCEILYVVDTHIHADHASAGHRLAEAAGAKYVLFADAEASPEFHGVRDGDVLELGNVIAEALHVPGHTPELICLLVTDKTRAAEPWFALTGHTLMVGDVGRTELAPRPSPS